MSKKPSKKNHPLQICLELKMPQRSEEAAVRAKNNIVLFPSISKKTENFRERVIRDLIRTRVAVKKA